MKNANTRKKRSTLLCALCAALVMTAVVPFTAFAGDAATVSGSDVSYSDETNNDTPSSDFSVSDSDIVVDDFVKTVEQSTDLVVVDADGNIVDNDDIYYVVLKVDSAAKAQILKAVGATEENAEVYDIFLCNEEGYELSIEKGNVKVTLSYPDVKGNYTYSLYHVPNINKPEKVAINTTKDGIVFTTSSFSPYALVWEPASTGNPGTGDDFDALPFALTAVVSLGAAAGTMVLKKKKEMAE